MKDYSKEMNLKENWKVKDLPYKRPDFNQMKNQIDNLCLRVKNAESYDDVRKCIDEYSGMMSEINYASALTYIRCYGDCTNEFYSKELPELSAEEAMLDKTAFGHALLDSKFADDIDKDLGEAYLDNVRSEIKIHSNGRELMAEEQQLIGEYQQIKASLKFNFDGKELSEAELGKYFDNEDRNVRKAAFRTLREGRLEKKDKMFEILRKLVILRNKIAKANGFDSYLDYMNIEKGRIGYGEKELTSFCEQVKRDLVPFYEKIYEAQAKRLGIDHVCSYDVNYMFNDGNPEPAGDAEYLLNAAKEMYNDMSAKSGEIFNYMLDHETLDIMASKNKIAGIGFCTDLGKLKGCVIFGNCNGTSSDVTVLTHEIGHAIQGYLSFENQPVLEYCNGCNDIAEVPSKIMEQFAYPYAEKFFGKDADKFRFAHMQECLIEIGGYCSTHEFETYLYNHEDATNEEWAEAYTRIMKAYFPTVDYSEDEDLFMQGAGLFGNMGVYMFPRYLISYALCDMCALQMKQLRKENPEKAWDSYEKLCAAGGSKNYAELLKLVGMSPAYEEGTVKKATEATINEMMKLM